MEIENMHPFCLPFSLCHDATSSARGGAAAAANESQLCSNSSSTPSSLELSSASSDSGPSSADESSDQQLDDLLDTVLESSRSTTDSLLGNSTGSEPLYTSLAIELSLVGDATSELDEQLGLGGASGGASQDDDELLLDPTDTADEWFATTTCSLLSPNELKRHQNVFQHHQVLVDPSLINSSGPIAAAVCAGGSIKSSPTLAQLNLNVAGQCDDPTEGLWTASGGPGNERAAASSGLSTSTLIGLPPVELGTSLASTNALQQAAAQQRLLLTNSSDLYARPALQQQQQTSGPHQQHHHHQHLPIAHNLNQHHLQPCNRSKFPPQQQQHYEAPATNNNDARVPSACTCQHSQQQQQQTSMGAIQPHLHLQQQRCASPALVSSSSSPPSCGQLVRSNGECPRAGPDSKLKENIDYLTALLCQGQQQPAPHSQAQISSSLVKSSSYATLAQSLASGPRLLERQQQQYQSIVSSGLHSSNYGAGDATSADSAGWFRRQPSVESSVSAADSTAEANRRQFQQQQMMASAPLQQQQQQQQQPVLSSLLSLDNTAARYTPMGTYQQWPAQHQSSCQLHSQPQQQAAAPCSPMRQQPQQQQFARDTTTLGEPAECPPTGGRPITLTPLLSNNAPIVQQQQRAHQNAIQLQQQQQMQSKQLGKQPKLFAQPNSPSASSTASSSTLSGGCHTDIGSSSVSSPGAVKRQQSATNEQVRGSGGRAPAVKRSHSLAGSLDEGFSSQHEMALGGGACSPAAPRGDSDHEEVDDEDDDDDDGGDMDSDDESFYGDYTNSDLIGASISDNADCKWTLNMGRTRRNGQKRFFWQYNVQSKGPKGARLAATVVAAAAAAAAAASGGAHPDQGCHGAKPGAAEDPFVLPEASDPVFSNDCQIEGVKHSGKARRGDGNDLTPNPRKLLMIGLELKKLSKIINELAPVTELPLTARNKTRKEKNKLASRACRLKKKAQHEANKIKLYGLQREHAQVVGAILDVRRLLGQSAARHPGAQFVFTSANQHQRQHDICLGQNVELKARELADECSMRVAGQSSDYVNSVLEKVVSGCIDGGLHSS